LIIAEWPKPGSIDLQAEADMMLLMDAVRAIRNARAERNVEAGKKLAVMIASAEKATSSSRARRAPSWRGLILKCCTWPIG
jgi:valyl-tRNA synthetase